MDGGWGMYKGKKGGHCVPQRVIIAHQDSQMIKTTEEILHTEGHDSQAEGSDVTRWV